MGIRCRGDRAVLPVRAARRRRKIFSLPRTQFPAACLALHTLGRLAPVFRGAWLTAAHVGAARGVRCEGRGADPLHLALSVYQISP